MKSQTLKVVVQTESLQGFCRKLYPFDSAQCLMTKMQPPMLEKYNMIIISNVLMYMYSTA